MRKFEDKVGFDRDIFLLFMYDHASTIKEFAESVGMAERSFTRFFKDRAFTANAAIRIAKTYDVSIETFCGDEWR